MDLTGRVAIITGGASGIGLATATRFAHAGATVVIADRHGKAARDVAADFVAAGAVAIGVEADVTSTEAVNAMAALTVERFGRVDILVNNAGLSVGNDVRTISDETWMLNFDVVVHGAFRCVRSVLDGMIARRHGVILNIASVNGLSGIGEEPYSAAKAGLINFTQNLAVRYGPMGIRANAIAPGTIRTPIWGERVKQDPVTFDRLVPMYPLRRVGESEDVAAAALFLVSDEAAWITGVTLPVDGGLLAGSSAIGDALGGFEPKP